MTVTKNLIKSDSDEADVVSVSNSAVQTGTPVRKAVSDDDLNPPHPAEVDKSTYLVRNPRRGAMVKSPVRGMVRYGNDSISRSSRSGVSSSLNKSNVSGDSSVMEAGFDGVVDNRMIPDAGLPTEYLTGVLEMMPAGFGYLRPKFQPSDRDVYVSTSQVRRFGLRPGDMVSGQARMPKANERYWGLLRVEEINGVKVDEIGVRRNFDDIVSEFPDSQIVLETTSDVLSTRMLDLLAPIGKGQRGLIVSPPKAGKTWLLKDIAQAVSINNKDMHLMAILIGERPEEVTYLSMEVKGEVVGSNFDQNPVEQVRLAELALERAKRLAEMGKDVFVLLDSITRLARAYNMAGQGSGRTMSGGFDAGAIFPAKKFLGAARKFQGGGSLTIVGTALIDTGSRMDELIYEEFKGTGNMEVHLDRKLAEMRIFPSIDAQRSGTRQEELLYKKELFPKVVVMRRMLGMLDANERTQLLIERLGRYKTNEDFLKNVEKSD